MILHWFSIRRRASRMADCSFEIFCESDQKIQKLKSYEQFKEKSKSVLSSEDFKEQHINCKERKCFWTSSTYHVLLLRMKFEHFYVMPTANYDEDGLDV